MPLEAVIFQQDLFGHSSSSNSTKEELFNLFHGGKWSFQIDEQEFGALQIQGDQDYYQAEQSGTLIDHGNGNLIDPTPTEDMFLGETSPSEGTNWPHFDELFSPNYYQEADLGQDDIGAIATRPSGWPYSPSPGVVDPARPKRRRARRGKNKEEIESQRMTHIAVERNRRKQMNEYLSALRSLMPDSYVTRVDQASIIGGAINFVKDLEQRLQLITTGIKQNSDMGDHYNSSLPFSEFFTYPQYSTKVQTGPMAGEPMVTQLSTVADIEVTMAETHASFKIRSKRRPKQLLKIVSGMQFLRLTVLHLNVTTGAQFVLYCLNVKVEDDCKLTSVDEMATSVHEMLCRIREDSAPN